MSVSNAHLRKRKGKRKNMNTQDPTPNFSSQQIFIGMLETLGNKGLQLKR